MKPLIYFVFTFFIVMTSCDNIADDEDYNNAATDMCDCVNKNTSDISDDMKNALIQGANSGKKMEEIFTSLTSNKEPEKFMGDVIKLGESAPKMEKCFKSLEKKYDKIYTRDSQEEVMKKMMETLKNKKSCEWTYAMMKIGMNR